MQCPRCNYDLSGLPSEHRCPECGCPYDSTSTSILLTGRRRHWLQLIFSIVVLALLTGALGGRFLRWDRPSIWVLLIPGVIAPAYLLCRRGVLPTRLVLHREGLELHTPGHPPLAWSWEEVAGAEIDRIHGRFRIVHVNGETLYAMNYHQLGTYKAAARCATAISGSAAEFRKRMNRKTIP